MPSRRLLLKLIALALLLMLLGWLLQRRRDPGGAPLTTYTPPVHTALPAASPSASLPTEQTATPVPSPTATAASQAFPQPESAQWEPLIQGLNRPVDLQSPPDGSGWLFVLEQDGLIRLAEADGSLQPTPFLDIRDRVGTEGGEQGLLGLAFDPAYAENGFFYLNYTDRDGNTVIARYQRATPTQADPASETRLLHISQPYANHNGGGLAFGPDGYLYIALGDGGYRADPHGNAQNTNSLLGKILRIDVHSGQPYAIPADNPFTHGGGRAEVWAWGLRNPWRFTFDPATGDLYIADVGQEKWEEVDYLPAGAPPPYNFGWDYYEGSHPFEGQPPEDAGLIFPVYEYGHDQGCSITGGVVYRGSDLPPEWQGLYLYSDFCSGHVWGLRRTDAGTWENRLLYASLGNIASFGQDPSGEVYLVDYRGQVLKLVPAP